MERGSLLIPDGDSEGFVDSVVCSLENPEVRRRLGLEARKQALKYEF